MPDQVSSAIATTDITTTTAPPASTGQDSLIALAVRVGWMLAIPVLVFVLGGVIFQQHRFSPLDIAYAGAVLLLLATRYVDVIRFGGRTAEGEPAGREHLRRYAIRVVPAAAALWGTAHATGALMSA